MAEERDEWASPTSGSPAEPPRYGERVAGWTPPPASPTPSPAPVAYAPPPRRGLIPLHPLSFGQLLGGAFSTIRWNPRATVLPALIITVVQSGLTLALTSTVLLSAVDRVQRAATDADRQAIIAGSIGIGGGGVILLLAVSVFGGALLQGLLVTVAARGAIGERPTAGQALRAAGRRIWPLVGVALLLTALQLVAIVVLALVVVGIAVAGGTVGVIIAVLIGVIGGLGLLVLYGFFTVKLATVPSLIVLERRGVFSSIGRSWVLMRGAFWRTFGLIALLFVIVYAATQLVSLPFSVIGSAAGGLLFPNAGGDVQGALSTALLTSIPALIVTSIIGGIGQIAQVSALVLVYLDRRMRTEGLDIELQRYVEQGGQDPLTPA